MEAFNKSECRKDTKQLIYSLLAGASQLLCMWGHLGRSIFHGQLSLALKWEVG